MNNRILQEIKERLDIVEFISNYLDLKRTGNYYKALCPFHQEKNPSFFVSPAKQIFKCFGCGASGDVITFYMRIEGLSFKEAVTNLAGKLGISLEEKEKRREENLLEIKKILEVNKIALNYYKKNLEKNPEVISYLKKRGLNDSTIGFFDIGYAENGNYLKEYLFTRGYKIETLLSAGLLNKKKEDKFQGRIIFPLIDLKGRVVGFTGRLLIDKKNAPKYLNTPDTQVFKKSHFIYGLVYSSEFIKEEVIVTEGQFDMILSFQNGLKNVVAISGSSFTEEQARILKRFCKRICFAFDNDEAGLKATFRAGLIALKEGFDVYKIYFSPYKDLGEFFEKQENIDKLVRVYFLDFILKYIEERYDLENPESKREILNITLPFLKYLDSVKVSYYINKLSELLRIKEELLWNELTSLKEIPKFNFQSDSLDGLTSDRLEILLERFLAIASLLDSRDDLEEIKNLFDLDYRNYLDNLMGNDDLSGEIIRLRGEYEKSRFQDLNKEFKFLKKQLLKEYYKRRISALKESLRKNKNWEDVLKEVKFYTEKLKELEKNV